VNLYKNKFHSAGLDVFEHQILHCFGKLAFGKRVRDPSLNPKSIALDIVLAPSATVQGSSEVSPDTV
jgi:hypothetical protein